MTGTKKSTKKSKSGKIFVGWEFIIQGKYYSDTGAEKKKLRFYEKEKFILPEVVTYRQGNEYQKYFVTNPNDPEGDKVERKRPIPRILKQNALKCFRYVIKHYHLDARLKEKYPDYVRFQTLQAISRKRVELTKKDLQEYRLDIPIQDMKESQLLQFMAIKNINVNLENYYDLADKKTAVELAILEKKRSRPGIDRPLTQQEKDLLPPEEGVEYLGDQGVEQTSGGYADEMDFFL